MYYSQVSNTYKKYQKIRKSSICFWPIPPGTIIVWNNKEITRLYLEFSSNDGNGNVTGTTFRLVPIKKISFNSYKIRLIDSPSMPITQMSSVKGEGGSFASFF